MMFYVKFNNTCMYGSSIEAPLASISYATLVACENKCIPPFSEWSLREKPEESRRNERLAAFICNLNMANSFSYENEAQKLAYIYRRLKGRVGKGSSQIRFQLVE